MNVVDERKILRAALERTEACPDLSLLIDAAFAASPTSEERARLEHAAVCRSCAAELELARAFENPATTAAEAEEIAWVEGRVELPTAMRQRDAQPVSSAPAAPLARVLPMRRKAKASRPAGNWTRWAAAALVVAGLGVALRWNAVPLAPTLPDNPGIDVVRSGELLLESPIGDLAAEPTRFVWRAESNAARYRFELRDVAGDLLHEATVSDPRLEASAALGALLESKVSYSWSVVALDSAGRELSRSAPAIFRF